MQVNDIPEIAHMSVQEKILFLEDMWETIRTEPSSIPIPQSHKDELSRRLARYRENPGDLLTLEELQARVLKRKNLQ